MGQVTLKDICKIYDGDVKAVQDVNLIVEDKEFVVMVGPSGCGKTTTLRMIAGLEEISSGELYIAGKLVNDVPPKDRNIAMVFQNYALYPHMSVYENMAFGLKLRKFPKSEIDKRVQEAAEILDLKEFLQRKPKQLSGGQRQRVAVGRAIVRKPEVFLFDEPLSNLDAKLRVQMRAELSKLHTKLQATIVYVTHDQVEAMTMGDRICVMNHGAVQQVNKPLNVYSHPINKFVAGFIGTPPMNFINVNVENKNRDVFLNEGSFEIMLNKDMAKVVTENNYVGKEIVLGIRPEDIEDKLYATNIQENSTLFSIVEVVEPMGADAYVHFTTKKGNAFVARLDAHDQVKISEELEIVFDINKIHLFEKDTEKTIF